MATERDIANLRAGLEAFNDGEIEPVLDLADPGIRIHDPDRTAEVPEGRESMRGFIAEWLENFDDYRIEILEIRSAGDRVVALCRQSGRGKGSGIEVSDAINIVFQLEDGRATELRIFARPEEALRFAGIEG